MEAQSEYVVHVACMFLHACMLSRCLLTKISALELSALLVGSPLKREIEKKKVLTVCLSLSLSPPLKSQEEDGKVGGVTQGKEKKNNSF